MSKQILITAGIAALIASIVWLVGFVLVGNQSGEGIFGSLGITRLPNSGMAMRFLTISTTAGTASAGTDGTLSVSGTSTVGGLQIDTGATIQAMNCATLTTWNPGSLATLATTTQNIALQGALIGDICKASISSSTTAEVQVSCSITASAPSASDYGTSSVLIKNQGTAVDFATSTLRTCYEQY